ncbi:phage tail spike protein [Streptococcus suis]|uniref:phage tail spike protein n=1 Tax=Streptococcus suis TaxID=1307 RepID=UPI0038B99F82
MLYLLDKDVKIVKWNGIPLHEASSAIVKEEVNGDFVLTVRYPITDSSIYQLIKEDMLIKAPTPVLGPQLFRIKKPVENDDSLDITAYHITDDIMQRSINPVSVVGQGCAMALSQMVQNAKTDLGTFSFTSDIMDSRTFNTTDAETLYSVLLDGKHSIVGTWEGELVRDNFALTIKRSRGNDRGVVITTHKNLKSYQRTKNSQNVVTRIHARSTFRAEGAEEETNISITVDSPLIGNYPYINEKEYQNNDIHSVEELRKWAERKFKYENIDKPTDEIKIEAYELDGQVVHLGDTVNIKSRKHDVDLYKKAIAYEYNALTEEYISITFDDKPGVGGYGVSSGLSNAADAILSANRNAQEVAFERAVKNANQAFDAEFEKRVEEIKDGIEQSRAEAERHADNIRQSIDADINAVNQSMQAQVQEHDRQVADILSKTQSVESLANQAKSDAASALARANQVKTEAIADARAQVATVSQALNTAKSELQTAIASADQKARDSQASATALRNDLNMQASKILEQARAQTALTNRVLTVETLADGTRSTVAELSKTVSKATGDIASVTSRTKTVEDTLSQTRTQYEALTQTVNTQTGQIDSINRKTADLQSGIDGVTEKFENLQIGGTNLLSLSKAVKGFYKFKKGENIVNARYAYGIPIAVDDKARYVLQAWSKSINDFSWIGAIQLNNEGQAIDNSYLSIHPNKTSLYFKKDISILPNAKSIQFSFSNDVFGDDPNLKIQFERGSLPTDYKMADEDLRSEIATYKRTAEESSAELSRQIQLADGKAVEAKTYTQQTATATHTRLESLETYKDGESTRASQYFTASRDETARQVSALRTAVTNDYVAKSTFEENARGVAQRFEEAQVGSINLVKNSKINETSNLYGFGTRRVRLEAGKKYWFGARARKNGGTADKEVRIVLYSSDWSERNRLIFSSDEFTEKFTQFIPTRTQEYSITSYWFPTGGDRSGNAEVDWYMVTEGTFKPSTWSPAPEDQQSYADTKIAEYKNTVDGRFATIQASVNSKANQVDFQAVKETTGLYERIIGSTEGAVKEKISRIVMSDSLFMTEVKDKISGTETQVGQLKDSWAVKLSGPAGLKTAINASDDGIRLLGRNIRIDGDALIDNAVITSAMIAGLDAGKITTGYLAAARIRAGAIDGSKIAFDEAFFNGLTANQANLKKLFAKDAFLTAVQAVSISASQITGGLMRATNRAMEVNLNAGQILYYTDQAALKRVLNGYPTQFVKFATGTVTGKGNAGVTVIGSNRWNSESSNDGGFVGIRAWNGPNIDQIDVVGDTVRLASSAFEAADGWNINTLPGKLDIDAFNAEHRASSKIKVGDLWLWKNATTYSSMRDTINLIIDNLQLLHNNKSTERGYSYTLPAKV